MYHEQEGMFPSVDISTHHLVICALYPTTTTCFISVFINIESICLVDDVAEKLITNIIWNH